MARSEPEPFHFQPGRILAGKYVVAEFLGGGWEGEAYLVHERSTGFPRVAKFYYPERNEKGKSLKEYVKRLEKLSDLGCVIRYMHSDSIRFRGEKLDFMVSTRAPGKQLSYYIKKRGRRLQPLEALLILEQIAIGLEAIHAQGMYHGDVHEDNVMVRRMGIHYDVRFLDFLHLGPTTLKRKRDDVFEMLMLLRDMTGGTARYAKQPELIKRLVKGGKRSLVLKEFPTALRVRQFLANRDAPDFI
ncbi:MAG: serine/threonine protein kinase [Planctomycetes bacterium]|nr:serine/threonine protein kinase [Planctomycetota bacterium]MCB9934491.1 serine/threonine protein kinase [Planctomycetota bacterium]